MNTEIIKMRPEGSFLHEGFLDFCNFLKERNVKRILEIGSYAGESINMFKSILGEDVVIVAIDPWHELHDENDLIHESDFQPVERLFNDNVLKHTNIVKCKIYSQDIADMFADEYFDCLYVDGLHTYEQVKIDLQFYVSKVKTGGIISGHDYEIEYTDKQRAEILNFEGNDRLRKAVSSAVKEVAGIPQYTFGDSSWALIK